MTPANALVLAALGLMAGGAVIYVCMIPFARRGDRGMVFGMRLFIVGAALLVIVETFLWFGKLLVMYF